MEPLRPFSSERLVAELLGVRPGTIRKWRMNGKGPPYVRIEGTVRYRAEDIRAWLASAFVDTLSARAGEMNTNGNRLD